MLTLRLVHDTMQVLVSGKIIWEGTLGEWSRALAQASVQKLVEVEVGKQK